MAIWNERIRAKRAEKGITLAQVADKLGVTEATAQRYESGNIKNVPYEHMCAYGELFNCSPAYLMGWELNQPHNADTFSAYFDAQEFTEEELDEIRNFIEFVKNKRK